MMQVLVLRKDIAVIGVDLKEKRLQCDKMISIVYLQSYCMYVCRFAWEGEIDSFIIDGY